MTEIKTNAHTLIVVPVPEDADILDCEIIRCQDDFELKQFKFPSDKYHGLQNYSWVNIGKENYNFLGTLTANEIDFDATPYVEKGTIIYSQDNSPYYSAPDKSGTLSEQSFRTLLQSHNIHFENPLGKEPRLLDKKYSIADGMMQHTNPYQKDLKKWQFAQSKVISKAVILLKK